MMISSGELLYKIPIIKKESIIFDEWMVGTLINSI